jgi:hypothetical protein
MLVCNVSQLQRRAGIAADLAEVAAALDAPGTGNVVFATLVDDPASVNDRVDAFLGQIMREAASATDSVSQGFVYVAAIGEAATALDSASASATSPIVPTTLNPADKDSHITLSGGNLTAAGTAGWTGLVRTVAAKSAGKYYWEATFTVGAQSQSGVGFTIGSLSVSTQTFGNAGTGKSGTTIGTGTLVDGANVGVGIGTITSGSVVCLAVDLTAKLIWFRLGAGGNWNGSGTANPATGVGGISISNAGTAYPTICMGGADTITANFGATAFTGAVPSGFTAGVPS